MVLFNPTTQHLKHIAPLCRNSRALPVSNTRRRDTELQELFHPME